MNLTPNNHLASPDRALNWTRLNEGETSPSVHLEADVLNIVKTEFGFELSCGYNKPSRGLRRRRFPARASPRPDAASELIRKTRIIAVLAALRCGSPGPTFSFIL